MSYFNIDGKIVNLTKCELCGAYKVVGKSCACEKKKTPMSNSTQNETHNVCNERLKREGGKATCCDCDPHEGCTLGERVPEASKTMNILNETTANFIRKYKRIYSQEDVEKIVSVERKDARKEVIDRIEKVLCNHNYSSMKSKEIFNVKEEIRDVLAILREEEEK